jgi:chondroitin 4-sulfotransferase 11
MRRPLQIHIPKTAGRSIRQALQVQDPIHQRGKALRKLVGEVEWEKGLSFTVIRNPFDRMVSFFHWNEYWKKNGGQQSPPEDFPSWITRNMTLCLEGRETAFNRSLLYWIDDEPLDFIGRFENLQQEWERLLHALGSPPLPLLHTHTTQHGHYRDYYTPETRDLTTRAFQEDLHRFNYSF